VTVTPESRFVSANGLKLHYLEWGESNRSTIVLLHGLRGHAHSWDDVAAALAARWRVLALDQRGRGESDHPKDGNYATEAFVDDLAGFCDALDLQRFILVGHSMGGRNGILFTARHPARVSAFAIVDVGPEVQAEGAARIRKELMDAPEKFDDLEAALAQACAENPLASRAVLRRRVQYQTKPLAGGGIGWRYDALIREQMRSNTRPPAPDFWSLWREIRCPTLILRGAETDTLARPVAERMVRENSGAQLMEIPRAAHMTFEDNPAEFNAALSSWLDRLGATGTGI
jgi:pimeloyl-ACP methyl ester carboxylesterase